MPALWKSTEHNRGSIWRRAKSANLQIRFSLDGQEFRESAGTADLEEAKRVLNRRLKARDAATLGSRNAFDAYAAGKRKLCTILDYYRSVRTPSDPRRAHNFVAHLRPLYRDFGESRAANSLTSAAIANYITEQRALGKADGTTLHTLRLLKAAIRCAHRSTPALLPSSITVEIPPNLRAGKRKGKFTPQEFAALSKQLPEVWRDPAEFLFWSGWRLNEMQTATWDDVQPGPDGSLRLILPSERSKNDDARALQLTGKLLELYSRRLKARIADCPLIFHVNGRPFNASNRRDSWNSACARTVVDGKPLGHRLRHDFRRAAVSDWNALGIPSSVGQTISGHRSDVYQDYNLPSPADPAQVRALAQREAFVLAQIGEERDRKKKEARPAMPHMQPLAPGSN